MQAKLIYLILSSTLAVASTLPWAVKPQERAPARSAANLVLAKAQAKKLALQAAPKAAGGESQSDATGANQKADDDNNSLVAAYQTAAPAPCAGDWGRFYLDDASPICIFVTSDLEANSGNKIALYSGDYNNYSGLPGSGTSSFFFGHNFAQILGRLGEANSFTVVSNSNGAQYTYTILWQEVACDYTNPGFPCSNYAEPVLDMYDALFAERKLGQTGATVMTCAGQDIGNGDATHRRVAYAVQI